MKHAGSDALDQLEPILEEIRRIDGVREKKRGSFSCRSVGFLHFHEDPAGFFADLKVGDDYVRLPINTKSQTQNLPAPRRSGRQFLEERSVVRRLVDRRSAAALGTGSGPARCRYFMSLPQCGQLTSSYFTMRPQYGHL